VSHLAAALALDPAVLDARWARLQAWLAARFGKDAVSIEGVLFLVGVQSEGGGYAPRLEKDAKERIILEASFVVFEALGLYRRAGMDAEGAWLWERTEDLPELPADAQERLLRTAILRYFEPYTGAPDDALA